MIGRVSKTMNMGTLCQGFGQMSVEGIWGGITVQKSRTVCSERAPEIQNNAGGFVAAERKSVPPMAARSEVQYVQAPKSLEPSADEDTAGCNSPNHRFGSGTPTAWHEHSRPTLTK